MNINTFRDKLKTALSLKKRNGEMSNLTKNCNNDISMMINNFDNFTNRSRLKASLADLNPVNEL